MALPPAILRMRDLLARAGVVDELQMRSAIAHLERFGGRLPNVLVELGMADEADLVRVLGAALSVPVQPLNELRRDAEALARLDARTCEAHAVFPVSFDAKARTLVLAMADPTALDVVDLVAAQAGARVRVVLAGEREIADAVARHYHGRAVTSGPSLARRAVTAALPDGAASMPLVRDASQEPARAAPRASRPVAPRATANALLDELLGTAAADPAFTEAELARLDVIRQTQAKTSMTVRALRELLVDKGLLR